MAIVYFGCIPLTALLARTPLAVPLTAASRSPGAPCCRGGSRAGRSRSGAGPDRTRRRPPRRPGPLDPYLLRSPLRRAGTTTDQNGINVLTEQIDQSAARRGDAPYLEDAAGTGR